VSEEKHIYAKTQEILAEASSIKSARSAVKVGRDTKKSSLLLSQIEMKSE
jgi:hypothetical protein